MRSTVLPQQSARMPVQRTTLPAATLAAANRKRPLFQQPQFVQRRAMPGETSAVFETEEDRAFIVPDYSEQRANEDFTASSTSDSDATESSGSQDDTGSSGETESEDESGDDDTSLERHLEKRARRIQADKEAEVDALVNFAEWVAPNTTRRPSQPTQRLTF